MGGIFPPIFYFKKKRIAVLKLAGYDANGFFHRGFPFLIQYGDWSGFDTGTSHNSDHQPITTFGVGDRSIGIHRSCYNGIGDRRSHHAWIIRSPWRAKCTNCHCYPGRITAVVHGEQYADRLSQRKNGAS